MVQGAETAGGRPATPRPPPIPGSPVATVLAGGTTLSRSAAAPRTGSLLRCRSQSSPCATAPPAATHARRHCWSVPPLLTRQRSTAPATIWSALGTTPLLCGQGSPAHAATAVPTGPGVGSVVSATLAGPTRRLGTDARGRTVAR